MRSMKEYEIYLPTTTSDGKPTDPYEVRRIKDLLTQVFGGYTHFRHRMEGAWKMGGVKFTDEVTIIRVLDDGTGNFDMHGFKRSLENALEQESVLIVERQVNVIS